MADRASFKRTAEAPARARRLAHDWLAGRVGQATLDDVLLLISELVTNAVRHPVSRGRIQLSLAFRRGSVRVEVSDPGSGFRRPDVREPPPEALGGRGLLIVDRVASRWGVSDRAPTRVWFEIDR